MKAGLVGPDAFLWLRVGTKSGVHTLEGPQQPSIGVWVMFYGLTVTNNPKRRSMNMMMKAAIRGIVIFFSTLRSQTKTNAEKANV